MDPKWFGPHVAYTIAKFGMSMCVLGMAEEFKDEGIAVNALWPRTAVRSIASNRHLLLDMFDDLLALLESNEDTFPSFDLDGQTLMLEEIRYVFLFRSRYELSGVSIQFKFLFDRIQGFSLLYRIDFG